MYLLYVPCWVWNNVIELNWMEIIFLRSVISQLQNNDIYLSDSEKVRMQTGVIWPRGVNIGNRLLIEAKMKGCQVRDWIVGERDMSFSRILYITCVDGD